MACGLRLQPLHRDRPWWVSQSEEDEGGGSSIVRSVPVQGEGDTCRSASEKLLLL